MDDLDDLLKVAMERRARLVAEVARVDKAIAVLKGGSAAPKPKSKTNAPSKASWTKAYWTPERRAAMSRKMKSLQKKKPKTSPKQAVK